jgi:chemotaxis protein methyltransferase CheR
MTGRAIDDRDADRFRTVIAAGLGLHFDDGKLGFLTEVLRGRLDARRTSCGAYVAALASGADSRAELRALAALLTVSETYFLRNPDQFRALAEVALPDRIPVRGASRELRMLSAGCASGEETYSLAIILREHCPELAGWKVSILGLDINPAILAKAKCARYAEWSLRETPAGMRKRYFRAEGTEFVLDETIRSMASFEECNLANGDANSWERDEFDIIFCRNMIMYLVADAAQLVVDRLTQALAPGGYLFLGHAETLRGLSQEYHLRHTHGTFYYQKRAEGEAPPEAYCSTAGAARPAIREIPVLDASWVDIIRTASERIESLARDRQPHRVDAHSAPATALGGAGRYPPADLGVALELLRQERYQEALEVVRRLPPGSAADPDAQLLRAVLLTNCGDLPGAEGACRQLLSSDDLNAGAHYQMALCREHAADLRGAMEHDRMAVYLDASFTMPHLHLGLLAKRLGDRPLACRELDQAVQLLRREDASRILLFGGGFSREALREVVRAELRVCGESR